MRTFISLVIALFGFSAIASNGSAQETAGVGIALRTNGEYLAVGALLPDGAAAASHAIHVGDRLIAVAQANGPEVRVKGKKINEVVPLVRGPKGTSVRLTIVSAGKDVTQAHVVSLVRGELKELARWGDGALLPTGARVPNVRLEQLERQASEHLADYAGKIVVLEFWSTGCGACQPRMAELQTYPEKYPDWKNRVAIISVNTDDDHDAAIKHIKSKGWNKTHNVWVGAEAMKAYHVNALPTVYVIDQKGKVVDSAHALDIPAVVNRLIRGN